MLVGYTSSSDEEIKESPQDPTSVQNGETRREVPELRPKKQRRKRRRALPLLEKPPSIFDSDEDNFSDSNTGKESLLRESIWDVRRDSLNLEKEFTVQGPESISVSKKDAIISSTVVRSFEDDQNFSLPSEVEFTGRELDRQFETLLEQGKSIPDIGVNFVHVNAEEVKAERRARVQARKEALEEREAFEGKSNTENPIDKRHITTNMRRKHQLAALAHSAHVQETDFSSTLASSIKRPKV